MISGDLLVIHFYYVHALMQGVRRSQCLWLQTSIRSAGQIVLICSLYLCYSLKNRICPRSTFQMVQRLILITEPSVITVWGAEGAYAKHAYRVLRHGSSWSGTNQNSNITILQTSRTIHLIAKIRSPVNRTALAPQQEDL